MQPGRLVVQTQSSRFFLKRDYGPQEQYFCSCFVIKSMDDRCVGTMKLHEIHTIVVEEIWKSKASSLRSSLRLLSRTTTLELSTLGGPNFR